MDERRIIALLGGEVRRVPCRPPSVARQIWRARVRVVLAAGRRAITAAQARRLLRHITEEHRDGERSWTGL